MKIFKISIVIALLTAGLPALTKAEAEKNFLTFINKSGETALVKLVGPTRNVVQVAHNKEKMVRISSGVYRIFVRYGEPGRYRYSKGESFEIEDVPNGNIKAQLTLHGVVDGNYSVSPTDENEFSQN